MKKYFPLPLVLLLAIFNYQCSTGTMHTKTGTAQSNLPDQDIQKVSENPKNDFQSKLVTQGIDFYARGNEPFWSLDMDFENQYHFRTMEGLQISVPPVEGTKASDANVTRYFAEVESGTLIITILEEKCKDTMSDEVFDFQARIQVKSGRDTDYKEYSGCGNFLPDLALHDIWVLEELNKSDLKNSGKGQQLPRFEFFAVEGKVLGNAGCNDFNGKYTVVGQKEIQFEQVAMTRKSCPDMGIEYILAEKVFGKRMKYRREGLSLQLIGYDGTRLALRKVD